MLPLYPLNFFLHLKSRCRPGCLDTYTMNFAVVKSKDLSIFSNIHNQDYNLDSDCVTHFSILFSHAKFIQTSPQKLLKTVGHVFHPQRQNENTNSILPPLIFIRMQDSNLMPTWECQVQVSFSGGDLIFVCSCLSIFLRQGPCWALFDSCKQRWMNWFP